MSSQEQPNMQMPEQNPVDMKHAEKFDAEGAPRQTWTIGEDQEVFYGSEKEMRSRVVEKNEERKDM